MTTPPLGPRDPDDLSSGDFGNFGGRLGDQLRGDVLRGDVRRGDGPLRDGPLDLPLSDDARTAERRAADRRARERRSAERRGDASADSFLSRMLNGMSEAPDRAADGPFGTGTVGVPTVSPLDHLYWPLTPAQTTLLVREALHEDEAFNDVTTLATVLSGRHARGRLVARDRGVVAGLALAVEAFRQVDPRVTVRVDVPDGVLVQPGTPVLFLSGHARGLLSAERVALNFLQRLSGVATLTRRFVDAVSGTDARILDTRKTTPGWRRLEKYAVRAGGGYNHRLDLAAAVLIKDNHLAAVDGDIAFAVRSARDLAPPGAKIEVECDTPAQVDAALAAGADVVMLDNMPPDVMRACAARCKGRALTEASGGVRLDTVRAIAETGVDFISVGALTHSAPALDLALDFE
jgi:nicotinate-nucleotide pyrophosphorylase (carboxylating)